MSSEECDEGVVLDSDDSDVMIMGVEGEAEIRLEQIVSVLKGSLSIMLYSIAHLCSHCAVMYVSVLAICMSALLSMWDQKYLNISLCKMQARFKLSVCIHM